MFLALFRTYHLKPPFWHFWEMEAICNWYSWSWMHYWSSTVLLGMGICWSSWMSAPWLSGKSHLHYTNNRRASSICCSTFWPALFWRWCCRSNRWTDWRMSWRWGGPNWPKSSHRPTCRKEKHDDWHKTSRKLLIVMSWQLHFAKVSIIKMSPAKLSYSLPMFPI